MLKIHRCYNCTGLCQIVGIQFNLADVTDKQSLYIFVTDIGSNNSRLP